MVETLDLGVPVAVVAGDLGLVVGRRGVVAEQRVELLDRGAGIGDERHRSVLDRVVFEHVDVDEAHGRMLERSLRRRDEVGVSGADPDHEIGLLGDHVGTAGPGHSGAAEAERVIVGQGALAGVGLGHGHAVVLGEGSHGLGGTAVADTTAGEDHRTLGGTDPLSGPLPTA